MFNQKLVFLMDITSTKNKVLADALHIDSSYISLIRRGKRNVSNKLNFIQKVANFFALQSNNEFTNKAIATAIGKREYPKEISKAEKMIFEWLIANDDFQSVAENMLLTFTQSPSSLPNFENVPEQNNINLSQKQYYYGPKGKQEAVSRFSSEVMQTKTPQTLLLFSDENMSWMYEDPQYAKKWSMGIMESLKKGNKIRIIHNTGRDLNELFEAVTKWVPLYASGLIESYYYPKLRDGVFQNTFFIAPKTGCAVISSSVKQEVDGMLHSYITDKTAVKALIKEYENFFSLCKPLVKIFDIRTADKFREEFREFCLEDSQTTVLRDGLSIETMPPSLAKKMAKEFKMPEIEIFNKIGLENIEKGMEITEIVTLPESNEKTIKLPHHLYFGKKALSYSKELSYSSDDFKEHLAYAKSLAKKHKNYKYVINKDHKIGDMFLYCKKDVGVVMMKTQAPYTTFLITESNLTLAYKSYLDGVIDKIKKGSSLNSIQKTLI